jgi:tetratricopeptide (TPR) repeat protein
VLTRIPFTEKPEDKTKELQLINRIKRQYLQPFVNEVSVIHSDRELEEFEIIKIAYEKDDSNTQISIDYLKLFEKLTKNDLSKNEIEKFKNIRESQKLIILANSTDNINQKLEFINKAIELNKNSIDFYISRANVLSEMGRYDDAIIDINKSFELNENSVQAINLLVSVLIYQKKFEEAEIKTNYYLDLYPNDINALLNKIIIFTGTNRLNEAEKICTELISLLPEYSIGYSCRGNTKRLMKDFENALIDVYKALELDSENIQAIGTLAEIYAEIGNKNEFYIHLENALKLNTRFMEKAIKDEIIYSTFMEEKRFLYLLSKYGIYLNGNEME